MADKIHFDLVSPDKVLFSEEADHIIAPGREGEFGVLPYHAPFMTTLRPGVVTVMAGAGCHRFFVSGGLADVTPVGFVLLAERAMPVEDLETNGLAADLGRAQKDLEQASDDIARKHAASRLEELQAMQQAATLSV